jgi:hypothetical protein
MMFSFLTQWDLEFWQWSLGIEVLDVDMTGLICTQNASVDFATIITVPPSFRSKDIDAVDESSFGLENGLCECTITSLCSVAAYVRCMLSGGVCGRAHLSHMSNTIPLYLYIL